MDKCNGEFIFNDLEARREECLSLCVLKGYPFIYFKIINDTIYYDINIDNDRNDLYTLFTIYNLSNYEEETLNQIKEINLCYIISDEIFKDEFRGCSHVIEIQNPHSYQCVECQNGFIFDASTKKCHQYFNNIEQSMSCNFKNIGDESSPKYTCESCNNEEIQTLVTYENEIKECIEDKTLVNCIEANADSSYIKPLYDCISCRDGYISYCSRLYQRKICQKLTENVVKKNELPEELYEEETDYLPIDENGLCEKNQFNPYKNKCFKCDNKNVGMIGCKGECSFSLDRSSILLCESECKDEFIESSPGICEPCENINEGCNQCEYTTNYPDNYFGIKRKRRFQCKNCMDGYALSQEKKCVKCSEVGLKNCQNCINNEDKGIFQCSKCSDHYFLNENGKCQKCVINKELLNNKCVDCDDINQGGIKNCLLCKKNQDGNKLLCRECKEGFILYKEDNICLERSQNDLTKFDSCLELVKENGEYVCSRCKDEFSLLKENGETKCIYTYLLDIKNYINDLYISKMNYSLYDLIPCHETENLGKNGQVKYSCKRCHDVFEDDELNNFYFLYKYSNYIDSIEAYYDLEYYMDSGSEENFFTKERHYQYLPVKVYDENIKTSYCILPVINRFKIENCLEAKMKLDDDKVIYQCTKCMDVAYSKYDKDLNIYYCSYNKTTKGSCLVKFCKDCVNGNNYFCSSCFNDDYEVNPYTGSCVKKTKKPSITWKDIFRLVLNSHKAINGNTLFGPLFVMRGITCNQINSRHAFLVYVTFNIRHGLRNLRQLKDEVTMNAICEIEQGVEATSEGVNIVDFECIGNTTEEIDDNYDLTSINEIDADNGTIISGNMEEINKLIKNNDIRKNHSTYTLQDSNKVINFNVQTNESFPSNGTFYLDGKISKKISKSRSLSIFNLFRRLSQDCFNNITVEMNVPVEKEDCNFCSNNESLTSRLTCKLEFKNGANLSNLMIKNYEIKLKRIIFIYQI